MLWGGELQLILPLSELNGLMEERRRRKQPCPLYPGGWFGYIGEFQHYYTFSASARQIFEILYKNHSRFQSMYHLHSLLCAIVVHCFNPRIKMSGEEPEICGFRQSLALDQRKCCATQRISVNAFVERCHGRLQQHPACVWFILICMALTALQAPSRF